MKKKLIVAALLSAITGAAMISNAQAELIDGVNKDIICKRPKTTERQLKIHSCSTRDYPLAPLAPTAPAGGPTPDPTPPYTS